MFKKSNPAPQIDLFASGSNLLSGSSLKIYQDTEAWHNQFRNLVTIKIDESLFSCLYTNGKGAPNASIRLLVSMMILKESQGMSDEALFENCRFNLLTRSAIGLLNANTPVPADSTYYLFRKKVNDYAKTNNINLFDSVFAKLTKEQSLEFNVSGKSIRMDSKLLGSNIAWLSRYELVHETLGLFYKKVKNNKQLDANTKEELNELLQAKGSKIVYTSTSADLQTKIQNLGILIHKILSLFSTSKDSSYKTLKRVFEEQYRIVDTDVLPREKEEISAKSVQSPHDTDAHFRNKDGNKVKGYSVNLTESCDDDDKLNLIANVAVKEVTVSDVAFFQDAVTSAQEVFPDKATNIHADGAYHSPDNQKFCSGINAELHLHAMQGAKSRYELKLLENKQLTVWDTKANAFLEVTKTKKGKWRIKTEKGYRYFGQKQIDASAVRTKITQTPVEVLQKRNNVEASIFQLGYHYPNAKSRYRGLVKHQMWANMRALWVNFVRILKFINKTQPNMHIYFLFGTNRRFKQFLQPITVSFNLFNQKKIEFLIIKQVVV